MYLDESTYLENGNIVINVRGLTIKLDVSLYGQMRKYYKIEELFGHPKPDNKKYPKLNYSVAFDSSFNLISNRITSSTDQELYKQDIEEHHKKSKKIFTGTIEDKKVSIQLKPVTYLLDYNTDKVGKEVLIQDHLVYVDTELYAPHATSLIYECENLGTHLTLTNFNKDNNIYY